MKRTLATPLLSFVIASSLGAQAVTGRIVNSSGIGVPGIDIDATDQINGDPANLANDGTDANGFFTTTFLDGAGVYDLTFSPPPPPTTTLLILEIEDVVVSGTVNLGTRVMQTGFSLSGRMKNTSGTAIAGVDVDVLDETTHQQVLLQGDVTNAFGTFTIAVPTGPIELQVRTDGIIPLLAPTALQLDLNANTNLGDIVLQPGFVLSGTVQRSGGSPVSGADIDVRVRATGAKLFTPGDNTDSLGDFDVVVAAGTYDVEICPSPSNLLVGKEVPAISVGGDTDIGIVALQNGVVLSGTIRDFLGAAVPNADVDARISSGGASVLLCSDNSNASGAYSVIVPTGTLDITFSPTGPACTVGLRQDKHLGVVIGGNTVLDGTLQDIPTATSATYIGDGINADVITPVNVILGSSWSAPLTIGHPHGTSGILSLNLRSATMNGANVASPIGGRLTEVLISGTFLGSRSGTHNGVTGNIPALLIPDDVALAGRTWAAQYVVVGGGHADLSRAVFGIIGCP